MHVLNSMFWVYVIYTNNKIGIIVWLGVIILWSFEKGTPWKFWLNPRFLQNSKSKWTLKWLSLDRGYFKFYFYKREKSTNNISLDLQFCHFISSHIYIAMHFILVKMSRNLVLLINNHSKIGDVETLARSSISLSP